MSKIRILTVNTHKGFSSFNRRFVLHELRDAVRTLSADVVFLQEVLGEHQILSRQHGAAWPTQPQYEFLADNIWSAYAYGRNAIYPEGHHGNALLSKHNISTWENLDISLNGFEKRGLLHCQLDVGEQTLHAICVHLSLRESHRQQQLQLLSDHIETIPPHAPLIVAGDFNDWRKKAQSILSDAGLTEVFTNINGRPARTFPAILPLLCLDRIYVRSARSYMPVVLPNKPWSHLSDHKPLLAEIAF